MSIIKCKSCLYPVHEDAFKCPNCGDPNPYGGHFFHALYPDILLDSVKHWTKLMGSSLAFRRSPAGKKLSSIFESIAGMVGFCALSYILYHKIVSHEIKDILTLLNFSPIAIGVFFFVSSAFTSGMGFIKDTLTGLIFSFVAGAIYMVLFCGLYLGFSFFQ